MNGTLNSRIKKLIKNDLLVYAKYVGGFFTILLVMTVLISTVFTIEAMEIGVFNIFSLMITMLISGIVTGTELPMRVRQGIARNEYFKATMLEAVIISIVLIPLTFAVNQLISSVTGSDSMMYHMSHLESNSLLIMVMYILWFIVSFLLGYFIAMIYQRFGWLIGVIVSVFALLVTGIISWDSGIWNSGVIAIFPIFAIGEGRYLVEFFAPELLGPTLVVISVILASGIHALIKSAPIKAQ